MALIWVVYSQKKKKKQCGFKNLFFQNSKNVFIAGFGEITFPSEKKGQMVPPLFRKKKIFYSGENQERSHLLEMFWIFFFLYTKFTKKNIDFFFFVRKMTEKAKTKALSFTPEYKPCYLYRSRAGTYSRGVAVFGERRRPARSGWSPKFISQNKSKSWCFCPLFVLFFLPLLLSSIISVLLSCIRTQSSTRPPDAVTIIIIIIIICLSGESVSASCGTTSGPDPPAEKHWHVSSCMLSSQWGQQL